MFLVISSVCGIVLFILIIEELPGVCFLIFKEFRKRNTHLLHSVPYSKLKDEEEKIKMDQECAQNLV